MTALLNTINSDTSGFRRKRKQSEIYRGKRKVSSLLNGNRVRDPELKCMNFLVEKAKGLNDFCSFPSRYNTNCA